MTQDNMIRDYDVEKFLQNVKSEVLRAKEKFPGSVANGLALTEEVGELAQALLHIKEGKSNTWRNVVEEATQVAAMATRIAFEGDSSVATPRTVDIDGK